MSLEIKIPAVGESITSGVIAEWHHQDGDTVAKGDLLLTLETDKVSTELTAEEGGVLHIQVREGEEVAIGAVVGTIDPAGESAAAASDDEAPASARKKKKASAATRRKRQAAPKPDGGGAPAATSSAAEAPATGARDGSASAEEGGGDRAGLAVVPAAEVPSPLPAAHDAGSGEGDGRFTRRRMSPLRRKIATQLVNAQQTAAILTTFNECDMSAVMRLRKEVQESFTARHGVKLGFMSFFIKAVVQALRDVPSVNGRIDGDEIILNHYFDIGVAVGTERGLVVPVVRDCDRRSFAEIEQSIADFAARARDGKITIGDLQGGVFTISNGGVYGSMLSTPILNPPQSGILGMHTIQQRPVAVDGKVEIRPMMYLALSYDHRIIDGREAVTFLVRVRECIEHPERLLVDA